MIVQVIQSVFLMMGLLSQLELQIMSLQLAQIVLTNTSIKM